MAAKPPRADSARERREDRQDLARSHSEAPKHDRTLPWYRRFGPGLITGAADDDPSGIGTYSATGAQSGYLLLWLVPYCIPLMIAVQEMCGRLGAVTGMGLAAVLKAHYPKWLLYGSVTLLIVANVFNVYADLNVMAASATMLFHIPFAAGLTVIAVVIAVLPIVMSYAVYARMLKWLCLSLLGYVVVALLPKVHNDWPAILRSLYMPRLSSSKDTMLLVVAFLGTTISPYLFFWQAGETVEEEVAAGRIDASGQRKSLVSAGESRNIRADTTVGMIASQAVALFVIIATAGVLHRHGVTQINTAEDAARALQPLGPSAYWIFTVCIIGTGLLAIPTLAGSAAYAVAETAGWRYGLYRRFSRAKAFYFTIAGVVMVGYAMNFFHMSPVKALVYSAAFNGIVAPPLIVVLLFICNNRKVVGNHTNGPWSNVFGWATVVLMAPAAAFLIYSSF